MYLQRSLKKFFILEFIRIFENENYFLVVQLQVFLHTPVEVCNRNTHIQFSEKKNAIKAHNLMTTFRVLTMSFLNAEYKYNIVHSRHQYQHFLSNIIDIGTELILA